MSQAFRFESILNLRHRERDEAAASVDEVRRAIAIVDSQVDELKQEVAELDGDRKVALSGSIAVAALMEIQRHQLILLGQIQYLSQQRGKLVQEEERRQAKLVKAQQALKSMEKLAEKHVDELQQKESKSMQSRLDEWSNTRAISTPWAFGTSDSASREGAN